MRERRLVFGEVADLYDQHRPAYPEALIEDLIALAGLDDGQPVLEVGAGTGKATAMFATRDIPVIAVEPSAEMAAVARRNCESHGNVIIEESDFEQWDPRGRQFSLLFSAQAWHWVEPAAGYPKARECLIDDGILALFWNRVVWSELDMRQSLLEAYLRSAPGLATDGVMHPANDFEDLDSDWHNEIAGTDGFAGAEIRLYDRRPTCSASDFVGLLSTTSEVRLLPENERVALFAAVRDVIEANGGVLLLPLRTRLCLARNS